MAEAADAADEEAEDTEVAAEVEVNKGIMSNVSSVEALTLFENATPITSSFAAPTAVTRRSSRLSRTTPGQKTALSNTTFHRPAR